MHLFNAAGVPSAGDVGGEGIALDVHENCADDYDSHIEIPFLNKDSL